MSDSKLNYPHESINIVDKEIDVYRDTAIRYCGYANEVGESFRPIIPKVFVNFSYIIAIAYVIGDCTDKTARTYKKPDLLGGGLKAATKTAGDVFLWQIFASVIIPGLVINRITWAAGKIMKNSKIKGVARKWAPTCVGLIAIPFIIKPIDSTVDCAMDETYRKYLK